MITVYITTNNMTPKYYVEKIKQLAISRGFYVVVEKGMYFCVRTPYFVSYNPIEAFALLLRLSRS